MRKTIYTSKSRDPIFKLHEFIFQTYKKEYKKNAPDMFVGIQAIAVKDSPNLWVLTGEGDKDELDKIEKIAKLIKLEE